MMYLKLNGSKLDIRVCDDFKSRFKSLKFYLDEINFCMYFPKKKIANTYFFCQRVDICFTDNDNKIIYIAKNIRSEKLIIKFKAKNIFIFPARYCDNLKINDTLKIHN